MGKRDVINRYILNLDKYKHLLSLDELIYDNKTFIAHLHKNYNYGDEKITFNILFVHMVFLIYQQKHYLQMYYNKYY